MTDAKRFAGKAVLVTGAASGIGRGTAERFAAEGAALVVADLNEPGLAAAAAALRSAHGATVTPIVFDAGDAQACHALVDGAVAALGKLDVVANIAGIGQFGHLPETSDESWDRVMRINLYSVFHICKRALPHLVETQGNIVNMASAAGLVGIAYSGAYCASKHGVVGLTKSIAVEFASRKVRANAVCPGGVNTPLAAAAGASFPTHGLEPELITRLSPKVGFNAEPYDIAAAVAYLASDEARFVTGAAFAIDGAQVAG